MRAVIVDDERLARDRLRQLLAAHPSVEVVGEADGPAAAVALIDQTTPDVVFLDIEMRDGTGFDVVERSTGAFQTIFITAFSEHAVRAFDVRATDYLLKPVAPERLALALERLVNAPATQSRALGLDDHVCLTLQERPRFIRVRNIVTVTAAGRYTEVRTIDDTLVLAQRSIHSWKALLPITAFHRVHRSAIVNLDHVVDADRLFTGGYRLRMRLGPPILASRRYAAALRRDDHRSRVRVRKRSQ